MHVLFIKKILLSVSAQVNSHNGEWHYLEHFIRQESFLSATWVIEDKTWGWIFE